MITIRGAIAPVDNTEEGILTATEALIRETLISNGIEIADILSIQFTATKDLTKIYPAVAAREVGIIHASLSCVQEMYVEGSLQFCIRTQFLVDKRIPQSEVRHVYLNEAKRLRPDIA